ncbi:hypothetical protein MKUB_45140 [Mycobacterium kubicae]|uniref:Uncharacterized protein n=1 Tax=Mycobacterium kubicae TaxID=120959 RepID=A0ABQ1BUF1_9MYCO|nr:hypothetical protein MKUB_45140 [Mycobacterium kubicae]
MAAAAAEIAADPSQGPLVKLAIADEYAEAAACNSVANSSQAADAVSNGSAPAPVYIRAELISGGNAPKSMVPAPRRLGRRYIAPAALAASVAA